MARTTASLRMVPPCTTISFPKTDISFSFNTLYRQFLTTEYASPAAISLIVAPSLSTCFTFEFIKTVHLVPKSHGASEWQAARENSCAEYPRDLANVSRKEPHPEEHASLISIRSITPLFTKITFISCPPISRIKDTSLFR